MANMLQSSQNQATTAPSYYTNYLSNLATAGTEAQKSAQYVGAQPLQQEAFCKVKSNAFQYQPNIAQGSALMGCAANKDITGAASQYLTQAAARGGLCAASPYLQRAACMNTGALAQCYMNPYIGKQVQNLSDIANRNIQMNLAPQATAAAVGSGQFGSQRGAQVLGQVEANALQCLNKQIACMESNAYNTAMNAAVQKQNLLGTLGGTAGTLGQQYQSLLGQLGSTAACAAAKEASAQIQAGSGLGSLATQGQTMNLGCINALATLGGQQRCIAQTAQTFPLTTLASLAGLLQGYTIPTSTKTTLCMSPLSAAAAAGSGIAGLFANKCGNPSLFSSIKSGLGSLFGGSGSGSGSTIDPGAMQGQYDLPGSSDTAPVYGSDIESSTSGGGLSTNTDYSGFDNPANYG